MGRLTGRLERLEAAALERAAAEHAARLRELVLERKQFLALDPEARRIHDEWLGLLGTSDLAPPTAFMREADEGTRVGCWRMQEIPRASELYRELRRRWAAQMPERWPWIDPWWTGDP